MARCVHQGDSTFDPGRLIYPSEHHGVSTRPNRPRDTWLRVVVLPPYPDTVFPITIRYPLHESIVTRFDAFDEDLPDRFVPKLVCLPPFVIEDLFELRHPAVKLEHVSPRPECPEYQHRSWVARLRIHDRHLVLSPTAFPTVALPLEDANSLTNAWPRGPDSSPANRTLAYGLVESNARMAERVSGSRERCSDPLYVLCSEDGAEFFAGELRSRFEESSKNGEASPES